MLDQALLAVHSCMAGRDVLAGLGAFVWGLASVLLSPCHLASLPFIVGYVAGQDRPVPLPGRSGAIWSRPAEAGP